MAWRANSGYRLRLAKTAFSHARIRTVASSLSVFHCAYVIYNVRLYVGVVPAYEMRMRVSARRVINNTLTTNDNQ